MRHLDLICLKSEADATLERLRSMGVVHLALDTASGDGVAAAKGEAADAEKAVMLILKARGDEEVDARPCSVEGVLALDEDRRTLKAEKDRLEREIRTYEAFGDFDPALAGKLRDKGLELRLYADGSFDILGEGAEKGEARQTVRWPEMRLGRMREKLARVENRIRIDDAKIAGCDDAAIARKFPAIRDRVAFEQAKGLMSESGAVAVISGWIPVTKEKALLAEVTQSEAEGLFERANAPGWGVLLRDPADGETPPTLIEPPKMFRPVTALFEGLGIAPAYTESDVSVPFMCYFSLFFAMLVGDGGYGAIFLAATLAARKKLPRAWFTLLTVFSSATIVWGFLSNTWFGAGLPFAAEWPTVKWLGDPTYNNMMFLCFTIGASHLVLARVWSGICMLNDRACLAQFGWAGIVFFMYLVTNAIVGIFSGVPQWAYWMFGVSLVLVFGFTLKGSELKSRGIELGMLPLNIMSALGDIISYVRLFAVGLASVKVAENFNDMAVGLDLPIWLKAVPMVLILLVGHGLNLAMAGLSILVHAVRLNTLEFSNHKGVSWAGYAFKAFKRAGS